MSACPKITETEVCVGQAKEAFARNDFMAQIVPVVVSEIAVILGEQEPTQKI